MKLLIVGTGRSGTQWIAQLLNNAGVKAGHQLHRHDHTMGDPFDWSDYDADVSFEAVPQMPHIDAKKILVMREPLPTIESWLHKGAFGDDMRARFALFANVLDRHFPHVLQEKTPQDRAARYWIEWNLYALTWADQALRLSDLTERTEFWLKCWGVEPGERPDIIDATNPPQISNMDIRAQLVRSFWLIY